MLRDISRPALIATTITSVGVAAAMIIFRPAPPPSEPIIRSQSEIAADEAQTAPAMQPMVSTYSAAQRVNAARHFFRRSSRCNDTGASPSTGGRKCHHSGRPPQPQAIHPEEKSSRSSRRNTSAREAREAVSIPNGLPCHRRGPTADRQDRNDWPQRSECRSAIHGR